LAQARSDAGLKTTRRDLLAGAVATGAGFLLPAELSAAAKRRRGRRKVDVAIVGAPRRPRRCTPCPTSPPAGKRHGGGQPHPADHHAGRRAAVAPRGGGRSGHRGAAARARRADRLHPGAPARQAQAAEADRPRTAHHVAGGLPRALLAGAGAERPGRIRRRPGEHDVRQRAAHGRTRDPLRLWRRGGGRAFAKLSRPARHKAVLGNFADYFGDAVGDPRSSFVLNGAREAWTRGCPIGHMGRNILSRFGPALRKPAGRIHRAGTETATYWNGYMDGAVRSGERAAAEALRARRRPPG
jgi:hypothetical protein